MNGDSKSRPIGPQKIVKLKFIIIYFFTLMKARLRLFYGALCGITGRIADFIMEMWFDMCISSPIYKIQWCWYFDNLHNHRTKANTSAVEAMYGKRSLIHRTHTYIRINRFHLASSTRAHIHIACTEWQ